MSRFTIVSAVLFAFAFADTASAQKVLHLRDPIEVAPTHERPVFEAPTPAAASTRDTLKGSFQFSLGVGFGTSMSSLHEELVGNEDSSPDSFGATATLTLGSVAFHQQLSSGHRFMLVPSYRGSIDRYVAGRVDSGFIQRHEASLALVFDRMSVGVGAGLSMTHGEGITIPGAAVHLDLRVGTASGIYFGFPLNITVIVGRARTLVQSTLAVEIGWQSIR